MTDRQEHAGNGGGTGSPRREASPPDEASATRPEGRAQAGAVKLSVVLAHPGPAAILDSGGRVVATNRRGEVLREIFLPDAPGALMEMARMVLENGVPVMKAVEVRRPEGLGALDLTLLPAPEARRVAVIARDTSLDLNLRAALADSRQRYKDFVDLSSDFTWETGPEGTFVFVTPTGALGYDARALVGRNPVELLDPKESRGGAEVFTTAQRIKDVELWARRKDGSLACLIASAMPILGSQGDWIGARGVCHDVTEQRERDKALNRARNRERILTHVVRTFRDELDPANMLNVAAEALARGLGAEVCHIYRAVQGKDGPDYSLRGTFGATVPAIEPDRILVGLDTRGLPLEMEEDGAQVLAAASRYRRDINGAVILWRDPVRGAWSDDDRLLIMDIANQIGIANEQLGQHERIITLSRTDSLTGLLNRRAFFEDLERRRKRLRQDGQPSTLMYVDLDNFKRVNDVHGHLRGDEALMVLKDILMNHTRPTDLIARLGGDEFAVWLDGVGQDFAPQKAAEFLEAGERLRTYDGDGDHPLTLSIGVAVYDPDCDEELEALTARADDAMYLAKHGGKGAYRVAVPAAAEEKGQ